MADESDSQHLSFAADIVAAFVSNNSVPASELPALIRSIHSALVGLGGTPSAEADIANEPAVSIRKSVRPDFIICLEDGKKFKSLKRHLASKYSLTPEQYRAKWNLPASYPMVAPDYAAKRSELAKKSGLGSQRSAAKNVAQAKAKEPTAKKSQPAAAKKAA